MTPRLALAALRCDVRLSAFGRTIMVGRGRETDLRVLCHNAYLHGQRDGLEQAKAALTATERTE